MDGGAAGGRQDAEEAGQQPRYGTPQFGDEAVGQPGHQPVQQGAAQRPLRYRAAAGGQEQPGEAGGVGGGEVPKAAVERAGEARGAVLLQEVEHPVREGPRGCGDAPS